MNNPGHPFPDTLPVTGALAATLQLQPVVPRVQAANDNDEPEPPGAAAAPVPRIGVLFELLEILCPALRGAAA
jgi:hypothetical protein